MPNKFTPVCPHKHNILNTFYPNTKATTNAWHIQVLKLLIFYMEIKIVVIFARLCLQYVGGIVMKKVVWLYSERIVNKSQFPFQRSFLQSFKHFAELKMLVLHVWSMSRSGQRRLSLEVPKLRTSIIFLQTILVLLVSLCIRLFLKKIFCMTGHNIVEISFH